MDTNTLISGTFWIVAPTKIIQLVEERKIELITSKEILEEYNKVMNYEEIKEKVKNHHERSQAVQKLAQISTLVDPKKKIDIIKEDPDDNKFIEAAVEGKAQFIISYNKHLLKIKEYQEIKIILPEEFLRIIKT